MEGRGGEWTLDLSASILVLTILATGLASGFAISYLTVEK